METILALKKEHDEIKDILLAIESLIGNNPSSKKVNLLLDKLHSVWESHEVNEEKSLDWFLKNKISFPFKKMIIQEHRELKGHWKVLRNSLKPSGKVLDIALDTDGRMLIDKFRKHIEFEDGIFDKALASQNTAPLENYSS